MQSSVNWNNLAWCLAAAGVKQHRQRETAGYKAPPPPLTALGKAKELEVSETSPELEREA